MASIKKLDTRKFKITVSNGYRPDGRKISRAKTITVPQTVGGRGISQYVAHEAEEFEKLVKSGYCEDGEMPFQEYAVRWLDRQTKYAPSTLGFYRRSLEQPAPKTNPSPSSVWLSNSSSTVTGLSPELKKITSLSSYR